MKLTREVCAALLSVVACLSGCLASPPAESRPAGTLLIVGGGLGADDTRPIYERLVELASARGPARIVIATAATGPQEEEALDKTEALRVWARERT